jgi:glucose-6-phosphate 1-epimerase
MNLAERLAAVSSLVTVADSPLGPLLQVRTEQATATISLYGAQLLRFCPVGQREVLWLSPRAEAKGRSIRGGVPVCFPWFADRRDDPSPGGRRSPSHGLVRTQLWQLDSADVDDDNGRLSLSFTHRSGPLEAAFFPAPFACTVEIRIGVSAEVRLHVENIGDEAMRFEAALHSYYSVQDVLQTRIHGLEGAAAFDKVGQRDHVLPGQPFAFEGPVDQVCATKRSVVIEDGDRRLRIDQGGGSHTVIWNPAAAWAAKLTDMNLGDWQRFVCVEAAAVHPNTIELPPGASHELWTRMSVQAADGRQP